MKKILTTLFILGFIHPTFGNEPQVLKIVPQKTYILLSDHKINSLSMTSNGDIGYSLSSDIYNSKSTLTIWAENEAEATIKLGSNDSEETFKIIANFSNEETLTDSFFALDVVTESTEEANPEEETEMPQLPIKEIAEQEQKKIPDETTEALSPEPSADSQAKTPQPNKTNETTEALSPEPSADSQAKTPQQNKPTIFDTQQNNENNLPVELPAKFEGNKK